MAASSPSMLRSVGSAPLQLSRLETSTDAPMSLLYVPAAARDRAAVRDRLARTGSSVSLAADAADALQMLGGRRFGLAVVDLSGERTALATIRLIRAQFPAIPVIGVMDPAHPLAASDAIAAGVHDLLPWPFEDRDIAEIVASARDQMPVEAAGGRDGGDRLYLHSPAMQLVGGALRSATSRKTSVLLCGESGTGRELIARTLHAQDDEYVNRPFVRVDCGAPGPQDLEHRVFGSADRQPEGAKSGGAERVGRSSAVIAAQGGSLFLTNVIEAPARVQAKLARLLRDREAFSVDVQEVLPLDLRVIASVGPDVDGAVADGRLRRDLCDRLAQVRIDVPPLRHRREDVPLLATMCLRRACEAEGTASKRFSRAALALLTALPWRGNVRELQDVITAVVRATRPIVVQLEDLLEHASLEGATSSPEAGLSLRAARARFERNCISAALMRHHGRVGDAAKALGIQRTNLYRKVRQLNVSRALLSNRK